MNELIIFLYFSAVFTVGFFVISFLFWVCYRRQGGKLGYVKYIKNI